MRKHIFRLFTLFIIALSPISFADTHSADNRSAAHRANLVKAASFSLPGVAGQQVSLADYRGKVVLVDFWASWCTPCIRSFPWMNKMIDTYSDDGFVVIAINMDQDPELAKKFLQRYPNKMTIAFDPNGTVAEQYEVMGLPNSFILNKEGDIAYKHIGFRLKDVAQYEAEIKSLLN